MIIRNRQRLKVAFSQIVFSISFHFQKKNNEFIVLKLVLLKQEKMTDTNFAHFLKMRLQKLEILSDI